MAFQVDIIPATGTDYFTTNIEDGVALADEALRAAFAARYPEAWARIEARRRFMADALGIDLHPDVLPFSNLPGLPAAVPAPAGPGDDGVGLAGPAGGRRRRRNQSRSRTGPGRGSDLRRGRPEELHRPDDVPAEDVGRALDAALATGHQPIQVGPPDEARPAPRSPRQRRIPAAHDPAVEIDLGPVADRGHDRRQLLERSGRPVELAAAVVRHDDRVRAAVDPRPGRRRPTGCP